MKLFCYFQIKPQESINFTFDWKSTLVVDQPELTILEADSHSEAFVVKHTNQLMIEAATLIVFFDVEEGQGIGALSKVLEALRKKKQSTIILLKGENQAIIKSLKLLGQPISRFEDAHSSMAVINKALKI